MAVLKLHALLMLLFTKDMFRLNHPGGSVGSLLKREQGLGLGFKMIHNGLQDKKKIGGIIRSK